MIGYRQHGFDPNAYEQPGPPLRPFNWAQWTGVAFAAIGAAILLAEWFGKLGWIPRWIEDAGFAPLSLMLIGMVLVNSRRQPATSVEAEQLRKNRKLLLITVFICAAVLGAAAIIEIQGAK